MTDFDVVGDIEYKSFRPAPPELMRLEIEKDPVLNQESYCFNLYHFVEGAEGNGPDVPFAEPVASLYIKDASFSDNSAADYRTNILLSLAHALAGKSHLADGQVEFLRSLDGWEDVESLVRAECPSVFRYHEEMTPTL